MNDHTSLSDPRPQLEIPSENSPLRQVASHGYPAGQSVDRDHRDRAIMQRLRALRPDLDARQNVSSHRP